jgi:hypothetical protein
VNDADHDERPVDEHDPSSTVNTTLGNDSARTKTSCILMPPRRVDSAALQNQLELAAMSRSALGALASAARSCASCGTSNARAASAGRRS